jgi:hypothetical protein
MRPSTPPRLVWHCRTHGIDYTDHTAHAFCHTEPTKRTQHTVQRCCNGCRREIGDMTELEGQCAVEGWPLPDVRGECRDCSVDTTDLLDDDKRPHAGTLTRTDGTVIEVRFIPTATPLQFLAVTVDGESVMVRSGDTMSIDVLGPDQSILYRIERPGVTP